tara:strand:+ start:453 stop:773 length:321 start_codon:yes stop_codon:yes gene_type:complete
MTAMNDTIALKEKRKPAILGSRAYNALGTFFNSPRSKDAIRPGTLFRKIHKDKTVETARVLTVNTDMLGIPHVRYELVIERAQIRFVEERRILALRTFTETYKEYT